MCSCLQCPKLSELLCFLLWELSMSFYILCRHRICLADCVDLICSFYKWWESFGSSFLPIVPPGFYCGFISTSACGTSTGVELLRLPWRTWVCPCEGQAWRWCSCLGHRGSGSTRYSGELSARTAGNIVLRQWHPTPVLLPRKPHEQRSLLGCSPWGR